MTNTTAFSSNRKFYGDDHFPYGLDRSGRFTRQQVDLLLDHGWAYKALAEGDQTPVTPEERAFVAVCQGEKDAKTDHEKVWQWYCTKVSGQKASVGSPLMGSKSRAEVYHEINVNDD